MTNSRSTTAAQKEIERLKAEIAGLKQAAPSDSKIGLDEYISVMSLLPYPLNLSTGRDGTGTLKRFTHFGEVKRVLYQDLVEILDSHMNFVEAGYFYILDQRVVRQHGLDDIYSKILTKEKLEEVVESKSDECVTLYKSASPGQQAVIVDFMVERLRDVPGSLNLNTVDAISRLSGVNIMQKAEEEKALLTPETAE